MKSIILYSHPKKLTWKHVAVPAGNDSNSIVYVRSEVVLNDALGALDMADPMPGETVLNTVELNGVQP